MAMTRFLCLTSFLGATTASLLLMADEKPERQIVVESLTTVWIREASVAARDAGVIKACPVIPGEHVSAGQVLLKLDDEQQILAVRAAELKLALAELNRTNQLPLDAARTAIREAEQENARLQAAADISKQQANSDLAVRVADKAREVAQFELDRAQKARESFSGSISPAELNRLKVQFDLRTLEIEKATEDRTIAGLQSAADTAAVARQAEVLARHNVLLTQAERELKLAENERDAALNALELAKLQLERRCVVAPFSGIVVSTEHQEGEWVEPGTVTLRLVQLDRLRVEGLMDAAVADISLVGRRVSIRFPERPDVPSVEGAITFVSPEIDVVTHQVKFWAEFDNAEHRIQPGLVATMKIPVAATAAPARARPASGPAK